MPKIKVLVPAIVFLVYYLIGVTIISNKFYNRAKEPLEFLEEAEQAVTVDGARKALEKGMPLLKEHFADTLEIKVWQSNLNYLKEQPPQTLLAPQIAESIKSNAEDIYQGYSPGTAWGIVNFISALILGLIFMMLILNLIFWLGDMSMGLH